MRNLKPYLDAITDAENKVHDVADRMDKLLNEGKRDEAFALKAELTAAQENQKAANEAYAAIRGIDANAQNAAQQPAAPQIIAVNEQDLQIGMSRKDVQNYSLLRLINAAVEARSNPRALESAGLEIEASAAMAKKLGRNPQGFFMPWDVAIAPNMHGMRARNDQTVTDPKYGGYMVGTELLTGSFVDVLRNLMVLRQAGARVMTGLVGEIDIPKKAVGSTAYWVGEQEAPTKSTMEFGQIEGRPRTIAGYLVLSRRFLKQNSMDAEMMAREDLASSLAVGLDYTGFHGLGTAKTPMGLQYVTGIGSVAGGTDGLAPAWSHVVGLETEVAVDNADQGSLAYITNTKVRGKLKQVTKANNQNGFVWEGNEVNGYPAYATNQVSSTLTKGSSTGVGVCSAIFFGNWADLVFLLWSGIDIIVDPYTQSTAGDTLITAMQDADIVCRRPQSFAAMLDALTS